MDIRFNTYANQTRSDVSRKTSKTRSVRNYEAGSAAGQAGDELSISSRTQVKAGSARNTQAEKNSLASSASDSSQTTFPETSAALLKVAKYSEYAKALEEHYAKANEENKRFTNPSKHIFDKYFNRNSPYYVKGLTQREREICSDQEKAVLHGLKPALNNYDPFIQETFGGINSFEMDLICNQEARDKLNDSIEQIFRENNIIIPEGADLQLTVDPYDSEIQVSGVDEELARAVENALNKGENGRRLYEHILACNPENFGLPAPSQFSEGDSSKMSVYHIVEQLTGYDIRNLENRDGKFYTPDGQDLWDVMTDKYHDMAENGGTGSFVLGQYRSQYDQIAKTGWESGSDSNLTIGYKDGSLYDIDTQYGYGPGQTDWQEDLKSQVKKSQEDYRAEREEILQKEEASPSKLETLFAQSSFMQTGVNNIGLYGVDGIFYPIHPLDSKVLENISNLFTNGLSRSMNGGSVIRLSRTSQQTNRGVDFEA